MVEEGRVGPLITSSREHKPPGGKCRVTLLSSLKTIFYLLFFFVFSRWLDNSIPAQGGDELIICQDTEVEEERRAFTFGKSRDT